MGVISRKYASVMFVSSIAFLMIAPLQVIDVHAAVPDRVGTVSIGGYSDISVQLNWTPPASASGITDYLIQSSTDDATWSLVTDPTSTDPTADIPNLSANTTYYFRVAAVSPDGAGAYSASVSQKTYGSAGNQTFESQSFSSGHEFGDGSTFANNQSFTGGAMEFGSGQTFGTGTEFADNQSFTGGTQTFGASQTFGDATEFADNQSFTGGTHTFGSGQIFGDGTEFSAGQGFTAAQTFGSGAKFGHGTSFDAEQTFGANTDFSGGTHTFSAAQEFKTGATFGASQTFGAGESHDFTDGNMTFGAGTDFGAARVFGAAMSFGGNQNWDGHVHTFGEDPAFDGLVNFAANQAFPKGTSFDYVGQTFAGDEDYTFGDFVDFAGAPEFAKARTFGAGTYFSGAASPDLGTFENTFGDGMHMAADQAFSVAQTFGEDMHFGDNTDFTAMIQSFKEGAHFGDGTTFAVGQELPADVVPPFGLMLSAFECLDAACVPADGSKFLAPGEYLAPGTDPDPISSSITKDSKAIEMDGLGFAMTFNETVSTAGTVTTDPIDPATLTNSTAVGTAGARSVTGADGTFETMGTMLNVSMGTAVATGTMDITLEYDPSNLPAGSDESTLEFIHYVGGAWIAEDTCTQDMIANKITCTVSTLSPVGIGSTGGSGAASSTSSSGSTCTQCKVLRTHGGFAIDDQAYTLVKKYNEIDTNEVKTGEPVEITLSVANASGSPRVTSAIVYMDLYGSPNNYKQSSSISYAPSGSNKININDRGDLWTSVDVDSEVVSHPIHETAYRMNYTFTMIFDKPMDTSHIVLETTNHYGIPEVLYVLDALKVVENDASGYTDDVGLQEESEPKVVLQSAPEPEVVIEPELVVDVEPTFVSDIITSVVIDLEPIPDVLADPTVDTEPLVDPEPKQFDFFAWLNSLFS